jgi:hypothetical protein
MLLPSSTSLWQKTMLHKLTLVLLLSLLHQPFI